MRDAKPPKGPVLIDLEDEPAQSPAEAPAVPDIAAPQGAAMQTVAVLAARKPSRVVRYFWSALSALVAALVSVAAWDYLTALLAARPILGLIIAALLALVIGFLLIIALRELAAIRRLGKIDRFQSRAEQALSSGDLSAAQALSRDLMRFYRGRADTAWGRERLADHMKDIFDADALVSVTQDTLLGPLDAQAEREIETAARQVATVTALVPLALADVVAALTANLRMIRRIAEVYGGRGGTLGAWRLTRAVMAHLVATGAVAIGDDLLEPVLGGSILGKLSRRFGEGLVNGALTVRVGIAAMEVCRPLPFEAGKRPKVRGLVQRALTGLVKAGD